MERVSLHCDIIAQEEDIVFILLIDSVILFTSNTHQTCNMHIYPRTPSPNEVGKGCTCKLFHKKLYIKIRIMGTQVCEKLDKHDMYSYQSVF